MSAAKARKDRFPARNDNIADDLLQRQAEFRVFNGTIGEISEHYASTVFKLSRQTKMRQHAVNSISALTDFLDEENAILGIDFPGCTQ